METDKETFVKFTESKTGMSFYVSNLGNIKRDFKGEQTIVKPVVLNGYHYVQIPIGYLWKVKSVHRIVAEAFIDNPDGLSAAELLHDAFQFAVFAFQIRYFLPKHVR